MYICGLDEVGRGALAGPLMAVASLFRGWDNWSWTDWEKQHSPIQGLDDSKKVSPGRRRHLFHEMLRHSRFVDFGIGEVSPDEINEHSIEWANRTAFERAVKDLSHAPHYIIVDGDNPLLGWDMSKQRFEPKADGTWWPVSAASILAKVIRDDLMVEFAKDYPNYDFTHNAGYGTPRHLGALQRYGASPIHRTHFIRKVKFLGPQPLQLGGK